MPTDFQYTRLWDYAKEVRVTNPGSTVILGTEAADDGEHRFSRIYVCFGGLKTGFKAGCRPIIRVDRCHLKGPNGGILLPAIGVDPNNSLFPIAYAVVNKECRETWEWFLIILKHDLNILRQHEFTFMSNKQKGLMQAFQEVFPVETYKSVYQPSILPMTHESLWAESFIIPPLSPNFGRGPGRPSKARRREADEPRNKKKKRRGLQKLKRNQKTVHCTYCGEPGHNSARCPEREPTPDTASKLNGRKVKVFTLVNHYGFLINFNLSKQQTKRKAKAGPQEIGACSNDPTLAEVVSGSNGNHGPENPTILPPEAGSNANDGPENPTILPPGADPMQIIP
ncbi:UNVERIFIED_CONTAM: hypothetical protein Slati_1438000 [Sesamum latifolium]|uniref:CCHC-type domain-containing protein n=1 Tax=Sesamum latifolium TaxID=2727402 RepID=A0AAW2X7A3_9LAMI